MPKIHQKTLVLIATGISVLLVFAILGLIALKSAGKSSNGNYAPTVEVASVSSLAWQSSVKSSGNLSAAQTAVIKTQADGRVTAVDFTSGDIVNKGQLLVELENSEQRGELTSAKAQMDSDQAIVNRYQKLLKSRAISQSDYDTAHYNYQISLGKVEKAQSEFDKTQITAPFGGKIGLTSVSKGQYLAIGDTIAKLVNLDDLYLDFEVPEKYSSQLAVGDKVLVESDAYPNTQFSGRIQALDSSISADTASLTVRANIPNKKHQLLPGSTVNIIVYYGPSKEVITIPQTALNYGLNNTYVYQVVDNKAVKTKVTIGNQQGQSIIITKGLSPNAHIIAIGSDKVHDQQRITIAKPQQAKSQ